MIKPKVSFTISFKCGHKVRGYRADNDISEEEVREFILKKFQGLCGECYEKYCKENNIKPWYAR